MAEYEGSIEIAAPPEVVFDHLVTEAGLTAWIGTSAELDPRPGGGFGVQIAGHSIRGEYLEVDRPNRVVFSWGMAGSEDLPPGASVVEVTLSVVPDGTRVELRHSGLPTTGLEGHADGWAHFLVRLAQVGAGGDLGPDRWVPLPDRTDPTAPTPSPPATRSPS